MWVKAREGKERGAARSACFPASARTCRGGLKRAGPDGVRASGPCRGRVGVVSRSVLCVGCGRDQGLGAVPADISGAGGGRKILS